MSKLAIEWKMECHVNGESFSFNGDGRGDKSAGTTELWLESSHFPQGFEPASCPCICNAPLTIGFAQCEGTAPTLWDLAGRRLHVEPSRSASIFSSRGEELLHLTVSSILSIDDDRVQVANEMHGFSRLPKLDRNLTPFDEHIVPIGAGAAMSALRFKLLTASGEILTGLTIVPYRWENDSVLEASIVRRYDAITVERPTETRVHTLVKSSILPKGIPVALELPQERPATRVC